MHTADGSENLLLDNLHVVGDVAEDGRLDVVALGTQALTTNLDLGTSSFSFLDIAHDAVELELGDLRALEGVALERVADLVLLGTGLEALKEGVVDALLDQDTAAGTAALAVVEVDAEVDPGDGVVDIRVVEDDVGALAAQLEGDLLQVTLGSGLQDLAADQGGASEGDLVNVHVGRHGSTGDTANAGDDVDDTWWEASLDDELANIEGGERGLLSGLEDDGVSRGDDGADLPGEHEQGEVPGDDLATDADGLMAGVVEGLGIGVDNLAVDLVCPAAIVSDTAGSVGNVDLSDGEGLAVVKGLDGSQGIAMLFHQVSQLDEHAATICWGDMFPGSVEGGTGSGDGDIDVLFCGLVDGGDGLFVVGVDGVKGPALDALDELVVDEAGMDLLEPIFSRYSPDILYIRTYRPRGCS